MTVGSRPAQISPRELPVQGVCEGSRSIGARRAERGDGSASASAGAVRDIYASTCTIVCRFAAQRLKKRGLGLQNGGLGLEAAARFAQQAPDQGHWQPL